MIRQIMVLLLVFLVSTATFAVAVDEKPLENPVLEATARSLMKEIRCVVCQNQSIEDSNADIARDLRQIVRERIELGDTPENVKAYLVDRYGDWVLLEPPFNKTTYFLWGSPFLFLMVILYMVLQSRKKPTVPDPLSDEEEAELSRILRDQEKSK